MAFAGRASDHQGGTCEKTATLGGLSWMELGSWGVEREPLVRERWQVRRELMVAGSFLRWKELFYEPMVSSVFSSILEAEVLEVY